MTFIVGLAGPAHVGKSTTMRALHHYLTHVGRSTEQRSFAQPIYEMVSAMTGRSIAELRGTKDTLWTVETAPMPSLVGWSPRKLLKHIGEFMRQTVSPDVWVERAMLPTAASLLVFDDARHGPEFAVCDVVIELARDGVEYACDHPSAMPPDPAQIDRVVRLDRTPLDVAVEIAVFILARSQARAGQAG